MVRAHPKTKTTAGATSVTTSADIPPDLLALIETVVAQNARQPGECTRSEMLEKFGGSESKLKRFLTEMEADDRLVRRRVGQSWLYRLKA